MSVVDVVKVAFNVQDTRIPRVCVSKCLAAIDDGNERRRKQSERETRADFVNRNGRAGDDVVRVVTCTNASVTRGAELPIPITRMAPGALV